MGPWLVAVYACISRRLYWSADDSILSQGSNSMVRTDHRWTGSMIGRDVGHRDATSFSTTNTSKGIAFGSARRVEAHESRVA